MECKKESNLKICNCTFTCSRKGMCCDCLHYHRKMGELPACCFPPEIERTGQRSVEAYVRAKK
jgi:hypothetical protein